MWKDFFYFSRSQRRGVVFLLCLILLALVTDFLLPGFFPVRNRRDETFKAEVETFRQSLLSRDSLRKAEWERRQEEWERKYRDRYPDRTIAAKEPGYALFAFDPNTADSVTFVRLGLKSYIASNILKYRAKGGVFRSSADFAKVYGILPAKFSELEPYISIAEKRISNTEAATAKRADIVVELNSADTTLLMQVKGVGRFYARGIVRFRQQTGGFVSVDQLSEVYGMRPENLERIRPFCRVDASLIQRIKVNVASVERMRVHPYLNFYKSKAIYELRRKKGKLLSVNDLKDISELTEEDVRRIAPYLSFE